MHHKPVTTARLAKLLAQLQHQAAQLTPAAQYRVSAQAQGQSVEEQLVTLSNQWQQLAAHPDNQIKQYLQAELAGDMLELARAIRLAEQTMPPSRAPRVKEPKPAKEAAATSFKRTSTTAEPTSSTPQPAASSQPSSWDYGQLLDYRERLETMYRQARGSAKKQQVLARLQRCQQAINEADNKRKKGG